jgi:hypothetical protein
VRGRLTGEYALREAAMLDVSELHRDKFSSAIDRILDEARRGSPDIDKAICGIEEEIAVLEPEAKRDDEIGKLSRELEKFRCSPGSWGFKSSVERAEELIQLETERQGGSREKSLEMHPEAVEVLQQAERHIGRDRGYSR